MTRLLASIVLMLAACGGSSKSSTTAQHPTGGTGEATVDPTVPSWVPESCIAYHRAVVQAINCQAVDQGKRDEIQRTFDATSATWKAEENADNAKVDQYSATCTATTETVRADIGTSCV